MPLGLRFSGKEMLGQGSERPPVCPSTLSLPASALRTNGHRDRPLRPSARGLGLH